MTDLLSVSSEKVRSRQGELARAKSMMNIIVMPSDASTVMSRKKKGEISKRNGTNLFSLILFFSLFLDSFSRLTRDRFSPFLVR